MANGVRSFVVAGATAILMGASMLGGQGSATAGTPQAAKVVAESTVITGQLGDAQNKRHCRWIWHRGYWQWVPRRYWDGRYHRWINHQGDDRNRNHRWIRVWHRAGWTKVCR